MAILATRLTNTGTFLVNGSFDEVTSLKVNAISSLYTTVGASTYSVPTGVTSITVEAWGGGGGSMGQDNTQAGGAGGAYSSSTLTVIPGSTVYLSVGVGGTGSQTSGGPGQGSWVNTVSNAIPSSVTTGIFAVGGLGAPFSSPNNSTQTALCIGQTVNIGGYGGTVADAGGGASGSKYGPGGAGDGNRNGGAVAGGSIAGGIGASSTDGSDGQSDVEGGGGGGGTFNYIGGMGGIPGGAGGGGFGTSHVPPASGVNTNPHTYGGDGGRGQVRISYTTTATIISPSYSIKSNIVYANSFDEVTYSRITPTIKNLLGYSQDFTQASYWSSGNGVTFSTSTVTGPDNSTFATLATITTTSNATRQTVTVTPNTQYTFSFFALRGTASNLVYSVYDVTNSANISAGVSYYNQTSSTLWNRIIVPFTTPAGCISVGVYPERDNGALGTVYLWGAQLELGSTATIYQGTTLPNNIIPLPASMRVASSGDAYVTTQFDEFTGAPIVDSSLLKWVDAAIPASYPGSGTTWTDLTGNGNNYNTITSSAFSTVNGGAFVFTGAGQIQASTRPNLTTNQYTVSIWVNQASSNATINRYITLGAEAIVLRNDGANAVGQLHFYSTINSTIREIRVASGISVGTTMNIVGTFDGVSTMRLYKNGVLVGSLTGITLGTGVGTLSAGDGISSLSESFLGNFYQLQIYNRALSADEISQNFNALRRRYGL